LAFLIIKVLLLLNSKHIVCCLRKTGGRQCAASNSAAVCRSKFAFQTVCVLLQFVYGERLRRPLLTFNLGFSYRQGVVFIKQ